jgi:hypothetical protein
MLQQSLNPDTSYLRLVSTELYIKLKPILEISICLLSLPI